MSDPAGGPVGGVTLEPVPFVPEIAILQAGPEVGLWDGSGGQYHSERPPPFWAFAWAGGQALARYVLDHPDLVRGLRVADIGTGSGLVAIAAARSGAVAVTAWDTDPQATAAVMHNARANDVHIGARTGDALALDDREPVDVVLVGDLFYGPTMTNRIMRYLRRAAVPAYVGDPGRGFLLPDRFDELAVYDVPVRAPLEDAESMRTRIWRLRPPAGASTPDGAGTLVV